MSRVRAHSVLCHDGEIARLRMSLDKDARRIEYWSISASRRRKERKEDVSRVKTRCEIVIRCQGESRDDDEPTDVHGGIRFAAAMRRRASRGSLCRQVALSAL